MRRTVTLVAALAMVAACGRRFPNQPTPVDTGGGNSTFARTVLLELFTASWCTNCPRADSAIDLVAEGMKDSAIVVEYHPTSGTPTDPMGFAESQLRGDFYGVAGWPVLRIDGIDSVLSAPDVLFTYNQYRTRASARSAAKSPVRIQLLAGIDNGQLSYQATIHSDSTLSTGDIRLLALVVEDSVYYNGIYYRKIVRHIAPDVQGSSLGLLPNAATIRSGIITLNPAWLARRLSVVAQVQNFQSREVLQSALAHPAMTPYDYEISVPDTFTSVAVGVEASYDFVVRHLGAMPDTISLDLPDSLTTSPGDLVRTICDKSGMCYPLPHKAYLAPGDSLTTLVIHLSSFFPATYRTELVIRSTNDSTIVRRKRLYLEATL